MARMGSTTGPLAFLRRSGAFLVVGGVAFLVDAGAYNLLVFGLDGAGPMRELPIPAKVVAIVVATVVTYVGNRYWTFGSRHIERSARRYVLFALVNLVAIGLQLGCLGFSRYVLGLDSVIADNVSGTLIGQALATVFRFVAYERWIFPDQQPAAVPAQPAAAHER